MITKSNPVEMIVLKQPTRSKELLFDYEPDKKFNKEPNFTQIFSITIK